MLLDDLIFHIEILNPFAVYLCKLKNAKMLTI